MITSNDAGEYTCHDCGHKWKARLRYLWWPIRLSLGRPAHRFFAVHGWEVGHDGIEQRVLGRTFHVGRLKIMFGAWR